VHSGLTFVSDNSVSVEDSRAISEIVAGTVKNDVTQREKAPARLRRETLLAK
jgi:hypothetical protein